MNLQTDTSQLIKLEGENELRLVVCDPLDGITLELIDGNAEIFGAELLSNKSYMFTSFSAFSVFTWHGCTLKLTGEADVKYIVGKIPVVYNHHATLEGLRFKAENECTLGPVTLIAGPTDVGKSTLCRFLLNCASRNGRQPIYIDLDVGQSSLSIPGTIGVLPVENPADITNGFDERQLSVYYFGYKSPGHNMLLYFLLMKKLSEALQNRLLCINNKNHSSGVIIDTCGWVTGQGYDSIIHAANVFKINILFAVGDKKLYSKLKRDVLKEVKVVFIPKLTGVVGRNQSVRKKNRDIRVHQYFYGFQNALKPYSFKVNFSDLQIFKAVKRVRGHIDYENINVRHFNLTSIPISFEILNQILALSYADRVEDLIITSVLGFICIVEIDTEHEIITVMSPQPSPLPRRLCLIGDILFNEMNS